MKLELGCQKSQYEFSLDLPISEDHCDPCLRISSSNATTELVNWPACLNLPSMPIQRTFCCFSAVVQVVGCDSTKTR